MRQHWTRWRWPIFLALVLVSALAWAPGTLAATAPRFQQMHQMGAQPLDQLSGDAFDQAFLAQMTMHHAMGVMMTQPVVTAGSHQELKSLGAQMIADQSREIEQMRGWLQGWYGQDMTCPMMSGAMPGTMHSWMPGPSGERPAPADAAGRHDAGHGMTRCRDDARWTDGTMPMTGMPMMGGFWSLPPDQLDATFMTWMVAHHQGAIDMAALAERASRPPGG